MKNEIKQRSDAPEGYFYGIFNGREWSIVDFGTTIKNHPYPEGLFKGWEAIEIKDGNLMTKNIFRAKDKEELVDLLMHL